MKKIIVLTVMTGLFSGVASADTSKGSSVAGGVVGSVGVGGVGVGVVNALKTSSNSPPSLEQNEENIEATRSEISSNSLPSLEQYKENIEATRSEILSNIKNNGFAPNPKNLAEQKEFKELEASVNKVAEKYIGTYNHTLEQMEDAHSKLQEAIKNKQLDEADSYKQLLEGLEYLRGPMIENASETLVDDTKSMVNIYKSRINEMRSKIIMQEQVNENSDGNLSERGSNLAELEKANLTNSQNVTKGVADNTGEITTENKTGEKANVEKSVGEDPGLKEDLEGLEDGAE